MQKITLNIPEVAKYLGIGRNTAYELAKTKGFPVINIKNRYVVPLWALEEWVKKQVGYEISSQA